MTVPGKVTPPVLGFLINRTVEFVCSSMSPVVWIFNNSSLPPNAIPLQDKIDGSYHLKIEQAQEYNIGEYTCVGSNAHHKFKSSGNLKKGGESNRNKILAIVDNFSFH